MSCHVMSCHIISVGSPTQLGCTLHVFPGASCILNEAGDDVDGGAKELKTHLHGGLGDGDGSTLALDLPIDICRCISYKCIDITDINVFVRT